MTKSITKEHPYITLASGSPRRKELVERIGLVPTVMVSDIPEEKQTGETPEYYTRRLALAKATNIAHSIRHTEQNRWVLSADTIVVFEENVLEKPESPQHAYSMLKALSNNWHTVITSFCWYYADQHDASYDISSVCSVQTSVKLRVLSDAMIERYIATGEPMDKAGGYGIQGVGSTLVQQIDGSYFCVVGLPVCEVIDELEKLNAIDGYPF